MIYCLLKDEKHIYLLILIALVFPAEFFQIELIYVGPVLVSNSSSLPEVAGNAVLYFNPNSIDSIKSTISKIIDSSTLKTELILKGNAQLKNFYWENTYVKTLDVYKSVV